MISFLTNELILKNPNLRILSLNNNLIGNRGVMTLSDQLSKFKSLEILYLSKIIAIFNLIFREQQHLR